MSGFFAACASHAVDDAVIDLSAEGGGTIRLENVDVTDLDAEDFTFYEPPAEMDVYVRRMRAARAGPATPFTGRRLFPDNIPPLSMATLGEMGVALPGRQGPMKEKTASASRTNPFRTRGCGE